MATLIANPLADTLNWIKQNANPVSVLTGRRRSKSKIEFLYPQNPFLTKKAVFALCRKFNLSLAPVSFYQPQIPAHIATAIESFKLAEGLQTERLTIDARNRKHWSQQVPLMESILRNPISRRGVTHSTGGDFLEAFYSFRGKTDVLPKVNKFIFTHNVLLTPSGRHRYDNGNTKVFMYFGEGDWITFKVPSYILSVYDSRIRVGEEVGFMAVRDFSYYQYDYTVGLEYNVVNDFLHSQTQNAEFGLEHLQDMIVAPHNTLRDTFLKRNEQTGCIEPSPVGEGQIVPATNPLWLRPVNGGYLLLAQWDNEKEVLQEIGYGTNIN